MSSSTNSETAPELERLRIAYGQHYAGIANVNTHAAAAELAVGGDFDAIGALEYYALKAHGIRSDHLVVDIGCGTGRLASQLARRGHQRYAGFDVVESAVTYARLLCGRPDWQFDLTDGLSIGVPDAVADVVCFFSVFTHISHEHTYLYLKEASRILRDGGIVIMSFLEFKIPIHWAQFESTVHQFGTGAAPVVFLDRTAISRFAEALDFEVLGLVDGDVPTFPIEEDISFADGRVMKDCGYLGQSLAILRNRHTP